MSGGPSQTGKPPAKGATHQQPGKDATAHKPSASLSPARATAFEVLLRIGEGDAHSDDLLHTLRVTALSAEDRNLTTALVMGVLRWQIALDARIAKLLSRPEQRLAEPVAVALRIGAFQLLHMDRIPAHAAINESVELCRAAEQPHAAGMVNAILRGIAREMQGAKQGNPAAVKRRTPIFESPAAFAERLGHPAWLVERWAAEYGREAALAICEHDQREQGERGLFPAGADLPQMDDGSRLVAELAAMALASRSKDAAWVWDCCAAPGGKTLVLAQRLKSAEILATDVSQKRLERMRKRTEATPYARRIRCDVMDATQQPGKITESGAGFDLILCDVPCSGTGTLARNPEIRRRLRPEVMARHAERQIAILRGAIDGLAPGGRLLYSTCSLEPEENERVVEAVLSKDGGKVKLVPIGPVFADLAEIGVLNADTAAEFTRTAIRNGYLRTLPGIHPCDGFFAALLECT